MDILNLMKVIEKEYKSVSIQSRQHTFMRVLSENGINMTDARSNELVVLEYKKFISGESILSLYIAFNEMKPINKDDFFKLNFKNHITSGYRGFVICE